MTDIWQIHSSQDDSSSSSSSLLIIVAAASASCVLVALAFLVAIVVRGKRQRRRRTRNPGLEVPKGIHQDQQRQALVAGGGPQVGWTKMFFYMKEECFPVGVGN